MPVFEEDQDLKACGNSRTSLWLLWFWCLSIQCGSEKKLGGFTGAGWTECQAEVHLFLTFLTLLCSAVWKGVVLTIKHKYFSLLFCITRVDKT